MQTLTDQVLKAARAPKTGRVEITDARCAGLTFRVTDQDARTFSFRFRCPTSGRVQRYTLGDYPDLSLAKARQKADELRGQVANGINPVEARKRERETRATKSFGAVAARYLEEHSSRHNAPSYAAENKRNLNNHVLPIWKHRHIDSIRRSDVVELIESLIAAGKPTLANRVHALVSTVFTFALDAGLTEKNPCARLRKRGTETKGTRVLSDDEMRLFWSRAILAPMSRASGLALRLILLTGCRPGEIAGLRRGELENLSDNENAAIHLPGLRTKNRRAHVVPLCALARDTVRAALELVPADQDIVFSSRSKRGGSLRPHSLTVGMARMAEKMTGLGADTWKAKPASPHDLRRTFRTRLSALGVPKDVRDRLMNHAPRDVGERHYDQHEFLAEKRAALRAWERAIAVITSVRNS